MRFFILAAGMGTRLKSQTENIPKCMVKIKGVPIIHWQKKILDSFKSKKITFYLITGYKSNKIKIPNYKKIINPKYRSTNMLYSLFYNKNLLQGKVLISYGDIIYSKGILKKLIKSKAAISIVIDKKWKNYWQQRFKNPLDDAETLKTNSKNYITEIGSKAKSINQIEGQYIGLIKLSAMGTQLFKKHFESSRTFNGKNYKQAYLTDFINDMIIKGYKVKAVFIDEPWIEIDTKKDLLNKFTLMRLDRIFR